MGLTLKYTTVVGTDVLLAHHPCEDDVIVHRKQWSGKQRGTVFKETSCSTTAFGHDRWCTILSTWVSFVVQKQTKVIHLMELGPRSFRRRTTGWCDLRTEGVLLNELESDPSASAAIKSLACLHTPRWSLLKTASGGPKEPHSPTTSIYLCIWAPCCSHTTTTVRATSCRAKRPNGSR